jgi:hypothetical protein
MTDNPYAPPTADLQPPPQARLCFVDMSTKDLKTLKDRSTNIRVIGFFWGFGAVVSFIFGLTLWEEDKLFSLIAFAFLLGLASMVYGCWMRPAWARIPGMVFSALYVPAFPVGTIIGGMALLAFYHGKVLFGPDRLTPDDLTTEYKHRLAHDID